MISRVTCYGRPLNLYFFFKQADDREVVSWLVLFNVLPVSLHFNNKFEFFVISCSTILISFISSFFKKNNMHLAKCFFDPERQTIERKLISLIIYSSGFFSDTVPSIASCG